MLPLLAASKPNVPVSVLAELPAEFAKNEADALNCVEDDTAGGD